MGEETERPSGEGEGRERSRRGRDRDRERPRRDGGRERVVAREDSPDSLTGGRLTGTGGGGPRKIETPVRSGIEAPRRRRRYDEDDDQPVLGFGDHMPAFLMRPARPNREAETTGIEE